MPDRSDVNPFVAGATPAQIAAILGAMRAVAETNGALSEAATAPWPAPRSICSDKGSRSMPQT